MTNIYQDRYITLRDCEAQLEEFQDEIVSDFCAQFPEEAEDITSIEEIMALDPEPEGFQNWIEEQGQYDEYLDLKSFIGEISGYVDRDETLIHEDEFEDYAKSLAQDCCQADWTQWPFNCLDWERAASDLKYDYSEAELNGTTYYFRA